MTVQCTEDHLIAQQRTAVVLSKLDQKINIRPRFIVFIYWKFDHMFSGSIQCLAAGTDGLSFLFRGHCLQTDKREWVF